MPAGLERFVRSALQALFVVLLAAMVVLYGSVQSEELNLLAVPVLALGALSALAFPVSHSTRTTLAFALTVAAFLAVWAMGQAVLPLEWHRALGSTELTTPQVSIAPADTLAAIVPAVLPILVFCIGLHLFGGDVQALLLLKCLAVIGTAFAVFGTIELATSPDTVLFRPRVFYRGSLTGTFINRNTAATVLGVACIICGACALDALRRVRRSPLGPGARMAPLLWGGGFAATLVALFLTQSRGGIASSLIALGCAALLTALLVGKPEDRLRQAVLAFAVVCALGLSLAVFGGRTLVRLAMASDVDPRFCMLPSILRLLEDNWFAGTGLGTFRLAFPPYRDAACGIYGLWDRAHNLYLEGWISLGVVFPVLMVVGLGVVVSVVVTGIRERRRMRIVPIAGAAILLLVALHSAVDFSLQIPGVAVFVAAALSAVAGVSLGRRDS